MNPTLANIWVLAPKNDHTGHYFAGNCPKLEPNRKLRVGVSIEIVDFSPGSTYRSDVFLKKPVWYEGKQPLFTPRRLFFRRNGFMLRSIEATYTEAVFRCLRGATTKHPEVKTLAIVFPERILISKGYADEIMRVLRRSSPEASQAAGKLTDIFLIVPDALDEGKANHLLTKALAEV